MTLCLENEKEVPCVPVCHGFKRHGFTSFFWSILFDLNENWEKVEQLVKEQWEIQTDVATS